MVHIFFRIYPFQICTRQMDTHVNVFGKILLVTVIFCIPSLFCIYLFVLNGKGSAPPNYEEYMNPMKLHDMIDVPKVSCFFLCLVLKKQKKEIKYWALCSNMVFKLSFLLTLISSIRIKAAFTQLIHIDKIKLNLSLFYLT